MLILLIRGTSSDLDVVSSIVKPISIIVIDFLTRHCTKEDTMHFDRRLLACDPHARNGVERVTMTLCVPLELRDKREIGVIEDRELSLAKWYFHGVQNQRLPAKGAHDALAILRDLPVIEVEAKHSPILSRT